MKDTFQENSSSCVLDCNLFQSTHNFLLQKYFYKQYPNAVGLPYGDISDRVALRKALKCRTFEWYLQNIYPEQVLCIDMGFSVLCSVCILICPVYR